MVNKIKISALDFAMLDFACMELRDLIKAGDGSSQAPQALRALLTVMPSFEAEKALPQTQPTPPEAA